MKAPLFPLPSTGKSSALSLKPGWARGQVVLVQVPFLNLRQTVKYWSTRTPLLTSLLTTAMSVLSVGTISIGSRTPDSWPQAAESPSLAMAVAKPVLWLNCSPLIIIDCLEFGLYAASWGRFDFPALALSRFIRSTSFFAFFSSSNFAIAASGPSAGRPFSSPNPLSSSSRLSSSLRSSSSSSSSSCSNSSGWLNLKSVLVTSAFIFATRSVPSQARLLLHTQHLG
mmetsp:Transcript_4188/g.7831  ORF Transcript_4188/g.7831 Transcript_4188/m.7831 type:complete len:226 (-) Transcript_4188:419-1096(-)